LRKAVNVWCYPAGTPYEDMVKWTKNAGYEGIEPVVDEADLKEKDLKGKWTKIKEIIDSHELKVSSVATGLFWRYNLASSDVKQIEEGLKVVRVMCEVASLLEAKTILVVPGVAIPNVPYEKLIDNMVSSIKKASSIGKEYNVIIGVENVWNRLLAGPLEFKWFLEKVNEDNVKAYFDIGNTLPHSLPEHWIRVLGKDIAMLHAKDFDVRDLRFRPILEGSINWSEVAKAIKEVGYEGFLAIEISPYEGHPYKMVFDVKSALDMIFK